MYILVLFLPLLGAIVSGLFGRKIGIRGVSILTFSCIVVSLILSCYIFYEIILNSSVAYIKLWRWFDSDLLTTYFGLQFDSLTCIMLVIITSISAIVHLYSIGYMSGDPHIPRFMAYLSLFTFLMIILVTSDNYIQLFIGWEGVGLCSYLLINFWLTRIKANKAAMKAMLINRVGDIGLVLAMIKIIEEFGALEFSVINSVLSLNQPLYINKESITIICILLFLGAVGKSAQLGLHTWLPDAMEGPTPVSALIHAATMVTAGVFLIIRSSPFFEGSPLGLTIITIVGALTALFAAIVGIVQNDLKKVVAYSTCSQLGYMVMICGLSNYSVSLFHLMNHAFFKALLFLSAGSVIHAISDEQDMRKMGGMLNSLPFTYIMVLIGSLSLMGFPYLTGFYSKDLLLELVYETHYIIFAYWLGSVSALLTAFYSLRLIYLTFIINTNSNKSGFIKAHEPCWNIIVCLLLLAFGSMFVGYWGKGLILSNITPPIIPDSIKIVPLTLSILGGLLAFCLYDYINRKFNIIRIRELVGSGRFKVRRLDWYYISYTFLNSAWQFNYVINHFLVFNVFYFAHLVGYRVIDRGLLEIIGPNGISRVLIKLTQKISAFQSGLVFNYVLIMVVFLAFFMSSYRYF